MVTVEGLTAFLVVCVRDMCRFGLSWDSSDLPLSSTPSTSPVWSFLLVLIFPFRDFSILCVTGGILEDWEDVVHWFWWNSFAKRVSIKVNNLRCLVGVIHCVRRRWIFSFTVGSVSGTAVYNQIPHTADRQFSVMLWIAPVYRSVHCHIHSGSDFFVLFYF